MKISIEQWQAFVAVVEEGSFNRAAERLNKSQSSVSYTIAQLEQRLPVPVLEQVGRKAELTEAGKVLLRQAKSLLQSADNIEQSAHYLASGWEAEISIAVDALVSMKPLYCALCEFSEQSPTTRVRLLETSLSGTEEALLLRKADIVLSARVPPGFFSRQLGLAEMLPVASPEHPLIKLGRPVSEAELRSHRQVVLRDTGSKREQDAGWLAAEQRWTVSHFSTSVEIVSNALGFAFIPRSRIDKELAKGNLVQIPLEGMDARHIPIHLILSAQQSVGPGGKAMADLINKHFSVGGE